MRGTAQSADGTHIYYERHDGPGKGPVLLFVHGVGGDLDAWQFVRQSLHEAGYSSLALDLRGHGYSDHPKGSRSYELLRLSEDIEAVRKAEGLEKFVLVGHSGGAVVALDFAERHQATLAGLVLIAGSVGRPRAAIHPLRLFLARIGLRLAALVSIGRADKWHSIYPLGKVHKEIEWRGLMRTLWHNTLRSYALMCLTLLAVDLRGALFAISIPTLLIAGENDGVYPAAMSRAMAEAIPRAKLVVLPRVNHVLPLNEPMPVAMTIRDFIASLPS
jgi:3-oxoadipate enol-lactonase